MTSNIEWLARPGTMPESWNFIGGCTPVSAGCLNCYAARMAATRLKHHPRYEGLTCWKDDRPTWTGEIRLDRDALDKPLSWRKPRTVFVCSMSDLFHDTISVSFIIAAWEIMETNQEHTFLVLTKRPEYMRKILVAVYQEMMDILPNVWLGVTVENEDNLWRVEHLLQTPAAVRYVSFEPLLGRTELKKSHLYYNCATPGTNTWDGLDWVIVGGESGPHAKPLHPDWVRQVRDQCQAAGIPFFFKQWGEFVLAEAATHADSDLSEYAKSFPYKRVHRFPDGTWMARVGKRAAGHLLDGKEWNEWPR